MASPFDSQYNNIREKVVYYANKYGINPNVAIWQIWQESKFNPNAHNNSSGADGIAQFIPSTAREYGVNTRNIDSSLDGYGRYMVWIGKRSYINNDISLMLAAYNAGVGRVQQYKGVPPFKETQNYVRLILTNANIQGGIPNNNIIIQPAQIELILNNNFPQKADSNSVYIALGIIGLVVLLKV